MKYLKSIYILFLFGMSIFFFFCAIGEAGKGDYSKATYFLVWMLCFDFYIFSNTRKENDACS
jgi:hypothetical protein